MLQFNTSSIGSHRPIGGLFFVLALLKLLQKYRIYSDRATAFSSSTSVLKPGFVLDTICDTLIYSEGDWMVVVGSVVSQNFDADELIINRL